MKPRQVSTLQQLDVEHGLIMIATDTNTINFSILFKNSTMREMGLRRGHQCRTM